MISLGKNHPKPHWIIGYTSRYHLLLDLDDTTITKAEWIAKWLQKQYPKVGDCLIVESSYKDHDISVRYNSKGRPYLKVERSSYHLIFDNNIGYNTVVKIAELLAGLGIVEFTFLFMRHFRGDMTLRVSPVVESNRIKQIPKPLYILISPYTNRMDRYIEKYLTFYRIALNLFLTSKYPKTVSYNGSDSTNSNTKYDAIYAQM